MSATHPLWALVALLCFCIACDKSNEFVERVGRVNSFTVPDTVTVGDTFTVTIHTKGNDACWQAGRAIVTPVENGFDIVVYDKEYRGERFCAQVIQTFTHTVALSAPRAGTMTIRIHSRMPRPNEPEVVEMLERRVTVLPRPGAAVRGEE